MSALARGRRDVGPWDVVVVGAGPAGAALATFLARDGHRVLVLEKARFPRFRIGESLLPAAMPVIERLGVQPRDDTVVFKRGARFVCEASGREQTFAFGDALDGSAPNAWHVERALFDAQVVELARRAGAEVRFDATVTDLGVDAAAGAGPHAAWVRTRDGVERARFLVDASGQSRLLARRKDAVAAYDRFGMSSVFTHFEHATGRRELGPDFDIRIMLREEGWGWIIPLPHDRLSVGMVSKGRIAQDDLDRGLLAGPLVTRLCRGARRLQTRVVGNFSYRNTAPLGARHAAVGDAACFLDPVFSSGVTLALRGAAGVADVLGPALHAGAEAAPDLLAAHEAHMDRAYRTFASLIERFYNSRFAASMFLGELPDYELRRGVMAVLAGDVWRHDNPFQEMLLRARRSQGEPPPGAGAAVHGE